MSDDNVILRHVMWRLAERDISNHRHQRGDPGLRTLEAMAGQAVKRGWQGRALAHHARAMALYPDLEKVIPLMPGSG